MGDGTRCGVGCNGSTIKNAIVYLPAGQYLVSTSIAVLFGTQLIGDVGPSFFFTLSLSLSLSLFPFLDQY